MTSRENPQNLGLYTRIDRRTLGKMLGAVAARPDIPFRLILNPPKDQSDLIAQMEAKYGVKIGLVERDYPQLNRLLCPPPFNCLNNPQEISPYSLQVIQRSLELADPQLYTPRKIDGAMEVPYQILMAGITATPPREEADLPDITLIRPSDTNPEMNLTPELVLIHEMQHRALRFMSAEDFEQSNNDVYKALAGSLNNRPAELFARLSVEARTTKEAYPQGLAAAQNGENMAELLQANFRIRFAFALERKYPNEVLPVMAEQMVALGKPAFQDLLADYVNPKNAEGLTSLAEKALGKPYSEPYYKNAA